MTKSQELFIRTEPISKLYTDNMGRFPIHSRRGNNFIMLAYHVDTNVILVELFASPHNRHHLAAADRIMANLTKRGHGVDLHILDNKCSAAYKLQIKEKWGAKIQLVPPDVHFYGCYLRGRSEEGLGPGRPDALPGLGEVIFDRLHRDGAVLGGVGVGEAWPG